MNKSFGNFKLKIKHMRFTALGLLLVFQITITSQKYTISGNIKDAENGEDLIGASIYEKDKKDIGTISNIYGYYSLSLEKGEHTIIFNYIGYEQIELDIIIRKDIKKNIELTTNNQLLSEIEISTNSENQNITKNEMSITRVDPKNIETIPVLFGEKDILKTLQLNPGIKAAGEGNSGFYVRGGGIDQNLIILDEAPVYNSSHLLGFFSVFNSDAIKDATLYKGGIPAEFGGRGSSVLDVKMKEGNNKKLTAKGGIGLISSRLTIEAPIVKNKGSFLISGRRSYADIFAQISKDTVVNQSTLYFYDLNLKSNYQINDKNRIYLSGYFGRDNFKLSDQFSFDWGNTTFTLRWNHLFNDQLFSNTSIIYSKYSYAFNVGDENESFGVSSSINDINIKEDFTFFLNNKNTIKFGLNAIHHTFDPGTISGTNFSTNSLDNKYALEGAIYIQNEQKLSPKIGLKYGMRYSIFNYMGEGTSFEFDSDGDKINETYYNSWESIQFYNGFEPRLNLKYQINENNSIKTSFNRNYQYIHLLSNSTASSPTDTWIPCTNNIKPQIIDQIAAGYFKNLNNNMFEFSLELYYKNLQNQIDYRNGADIILNGEVESELVYGNGMAYGTELFIQKTTGKLKGWVSYCLSRTFRQFDEINNGNFFPARQDRIHDIAIVLMYKLNEKWSFSSSWVYNTGNAVTFPSGKYNMNGVTVPLYTERNGYRMPNYHRLDIGATCYLKKKKNRESSWNFSIYNAYNRENAYTITFRQTENENDNSMAREAIQTTLFKIVPSITYNFYFK